MVWQAVEGSFRDPSGFVYARDGTIYRQVNHSFRQPFEAFLASGLYDELVRDGMLVPHEQMGLELAATNDAYAVIRPERITFIIPLRVVLWATARCRIADARYKERALAKGFTLRDSSAYNIQFQGGRPVLIDTLTFEPHVERKPWDASNSFASSFCSR